MDVAAQPGQGEAVEAELDRLVERRSRQKDPDEESELWKESVRDTKRSADRWHASSGALFIAVRLSATVPPYER